MRASWAHKTRQLVVQLYISEQSVPLVSEQSVPLVSEQSVPPVSEQSVPFKDELMA
jgi:hypothetical protein